jgi:hypothetical protein
VEIFTLDFNGLVLHVDHKDDLIPAPVDGCPKVVITASNDGKITICHATDSATNPYNEITIDFNGLRGHSDHKSDIIPAPINGCPLVTATPGITATPTLTQTPTITPAGTTTGNNDGKITICHATGSKKNPYVLITISVNGMNGHGKHARDIIPAPPEVVLNNQAICCTETELPALCIPSPPKWRNKSSPS